MIQLNDKDLRSIKLQVLPQFALSLGLFMYGIIANSDSIAYSGFSIALAALCYGVVQRCILAGNIPASTPIYYAVDMRASRFEQEMALERIPKILRAENPIGFWMRLSLFIICGLGSYLIAWVVLIYGIEAIRS